MKVTDKRISSAKVFRKGINIQLKKSFVCVFFKNTDEIFLFIREYILEFNHAVICKINSCAVFSVRIITGIAVLKTVNGKINVFGISLTSGSLCRAEMRFLKMSRR